MRAQIVHNRINPLGLGRQPSLDLLQKRDPVCATAPRTGPGESRARSRHKGAEDIALAAPTIVDLLLGAVWCRWAQRPTRIALGAHGPHLVEADDETALRRGRVEGLDLPLFRRTRGRPARRTRSRACASA